MQLVLDPNHLSRRISSKESFSFPNLKEICADCPSPNHIHHPGQEQSHSLTISPVSCMLFWVIFLRLIQVKWHKPRLTVGSCFSNCGLNINLMQEGFSVLLSLCIYARLMRGNVFPCLFSEQIFQTPWRAPTGVWKGCSCCCGASSTAWSLPASWT